MDALRAFAMLLGIALHALQAFTQPTGGVEDSRLNEQFVQLFLLAIHGFRMPLFFLVSGFFTAMLCAQAGDSVLAEEPGPADSAALHARARDDRTGDALGLRLGGRACRSGIGTLGPTTGAWPLPSGRATKRPSGSVSTTGPTSAHPIRNSG